MLKRHNVCKRAVWTMLVLLLPISAFAGVPTEWVRTLNGPGNGYDQVLCMETDAAGNVFVSGTSSFYGGPSYAITTVKYDPDGNMLWENRYGDEVLITHAPNALCLDDAGNVYVAGYGGGMVNDPVGHDLIILKIDSEGNLVWDRTYAGTAGDGDRADAIGVDGDGNVFVVGGVTNTESGWDYVTLKYDPAGVLLWDRIYSGPGMGLDDPLDLVIDDQGNVIVTGTTENLDESKDIMTLKYDRAGTLLWERRYDGAVPGNDIPDAMTIDASNNVYLAASTTASLPNRDIVTIKYAPDGTVLWEEVYGSARNATEYANVIQLDAAGNVLVGGRGYKAGGSEPAIMTLKYDNFGTLILAREFFLTPEQDQNMHDMAFDSGENLYVTGSKLKTPDTYDYDISTIKAAPNGMVEWIKRYNGPADLADFAYTLRLDVSGNVYVGGGSYNASINSDFITVKYGTEPCDCPYQADIDGSGFIDAIDLGLTIDVLFAGGPEIQDPECPAARSDFNADGFPDALDLGSLIGYLFDGGVGPTDPCGP